VVVFVELRKNLRTRRGQSWYRHSTLWTRQFFYNHTISESSNHAIIYVRLHPRARRNAVIGKVRDAIKIAVTAPPLDGRANEACVELLAKLFRLPKSSITIAAGEKARDKRLRIEGIRQAAAEALLASALPANH
jgi:uncharacterized protein